MHRAISPIAVAATLAAISAVTLTDPTLPDGEAALLGRRPAGVVSPLRLAPSEGPVGADRALLGQLASTNEASAASAIIHLRSRKGDGASALLGQ